jgi:hypothetical protein
LEVLVHLYQEPAVFFWCGNQLTQAALQVLSPGRQRAGAPEARQFLKESGAEIQKSPQQIHRSPLHGVEGNRASKDSPWGIFHGHSQSQAFQTRLPGVAGIFGLVMMLAVGGISTPANAHLSDPGFQGLEFLLLDGKALADWLPSQQIQDLSGLQASPYQP